MGPTFFVGSVSYVFFVSCPKEPLLIWLKVILKVDQPSYNPKTAGKVAGIEIESTAGIEIDDGRKTEVIKQTNQNCVFFFKWNTRKRIAHINSHLSKTLYFTSYMKRETDAILNILKLNSIPKKS